MITGLLMEWKDLNEKDYDRITSVLDLAKTPPKGALFHCAGVYPGGFRVFDIWESQEAFERFRKERLDPAMKQAGLTDRRPSRTEFYNLYNVQAFDPTALRNLLPQPVRA